MALLQLDEIRAHLNLGRDTSHDAELERWLAAAEAHIRRRYGTLPSGTYTELVRVIDGRILLSHTPVLTVTSVSQLHGASYTTEVTISSDRQFVSHDNVRAGEWTVVYTAGHTAVPADLKLDILEDVGVLYQRSQIGPPNTLGGLGVETEAAGAPPVPIRMWPRTDGWIADNTIPAIA